MHYTTLGNTGLVVSRLAFGAMTFTAGKKSIAAVAASHPDGGRPRRGRLTPAADRDTLVAL